ncbi:MAG: flagellar hook-associated protein FlgL [Nitrospinaceae bacterium]|nr:flagellar hook-associated protein FlgL [Nitrospinaceae bacterium]
MVMRVTSQTQQRSELNNIFRITENMFNAQKQITSGKKIHKPSDDPSGMRDTLALRTNIKEVTQYNRNITNNKLFLTTGESALSSVSLHLIRAKEMSVAELGGQATAETRGYAREELDNIIAKVLQDANTKVKSMYIFSGTAVNTSPFEVSASGAVYKGNSDNLTIKIEENTTVKLTLPGSQALGTDMNPKLTASTKLSSLNGGSGVQSGSILITDRAGNTGKFNITSSMTIDNVITTISTMSNITASINSAGNGITLTDTSSLIANSLTVSEVDGGTTAASLGILGKKDGNIVGADLDATLSTDTLISDLYDGEGLNLGDIRIVNGATSGTVSLSSATTIGGAIDLINAAASGTVTASIDSAGNSLRVVSKNSSTIAVVNNVGSDTTAEELGIGGGRNVLNTLLKLKQSLDKDDSQGILASLANIDSGMEAVNESMVFYGGITRRINSTEAGHHERIVNQNEQILNIEGADMVEAAAEFASMEAALQASLSTTARIIQPSLLDFLR